MKHLLTILCLILNSIFFNLQSQAQCHIDDWTALKALYESTDGDNWTNNAGWGLVKESSPRTGCDLSLLFGVEIDQEGRVSCLDLDGDDNCGLNDFGTNNLKGFVPYEITYLDNLKYLILGNNQLMGGIPSNLGTLNKLLVLDLGHNQLSNNIPPELGKLSNLEYLILSGNNLIGNIPIELSKLSNLRLLFLDRNKLTGNIPFELSYISKLERLSLHRNDLNGAIPSELSNLNQLEALYLYRNRLTGKIPKELSYLSELEILSLQENNLTGDIPPSLSNLRKLIFLNLSSNDLTGSIPIELKNIKSLSGLILSNNRLESQIPRFSLTTLKVENNNFTCQDLKDSFYENLQRNYIFTYKPQYFTPSNYKDIVSNVFDTINTNQSIRLNVNLEIENKNGIEFQWLRNETLVTNGINYTLAIDTTLTILDIRPENVGKYALRIISDCFYEEGFSFPFLMESEPIYIIKKGYDLQGQPIEYDQIMVQFDNAEETAKYETEILTPNAGWVKKACNCNRELYLWQFPTTEAAIAALLEIDRKKKRIKSKNKPKGGFNNNINLGETTEIPIAYNIVSDAFNQTYTDSVMMFLLDSGLDEVQDKFLLNEASIDSCYNIEKAKGYSYVDSITTVSTNYVDELWHGTFGYHSITQNLKDESAIKIVPLKIFDKNGKGNLFDMVCAMYHAIDHNADVINISAGYYGEPSDILESAINEAREKGIFITAAAGNDTINMDNKPQYPAYYAGQYNVFETYDESGEVQLDSVKYDNVISIASIDAQNQLSQFSNFGKQSATIACYGENIHSYGIDGLDVVASGTSMSTFLASKALALEIAKDKQRNYQQIWSDFESNWLIDNPSLVEVTQTSKQINIAVEEATIKGCTNPNYINYFPFATEDDGTCEITNIEDRVTGFEMYPNPSNGMVQLAFNNHVNLVKQISVIDCLGKSVLSISSSDEIVQIQLDAFAKGIYFIRIHIAEKMIIQKLVLK